MADNQGDFAQPLAGLVQQQQVNVTSAITGGLADVQKDGTTVDVEIRSKLNFISGDGTSLTVADNAGSDRVDVTIATNFEILKHGTKTSSVTSTGGSFATGQDVLDSALSVTFDGTSDYAVRVISPSWRNSTSGDGMAMHINLDGADAGIMAQAYSPGANKDENGSLVGVLVAPASGSHTVNVRISALVGGTAQINAGSGGAGAFLPIRVSVERMS